MSEESPRQIVIGDTTYDVPRFRGLKAVLAGALISRTMREIPQLQSRVAQFRKDYRNNNTIKVTRAMAKLPSYEVLGLTSEDFGDNEYLELPEEPASGTIVVNVFPDLFELAQKELQRFLALIVISNRDLEDADDDDRVEEALTTLGKRLLRSGDLDELLELLVIGGEIIQDQMASKKDRLAKLPLPILQRILNPPEEVLPENNGHGETPQEESGKEMESPQSQNSAQPSSTDSPSDSGGTGEQLSMASPGMSSDS